MTVTVPVDAWVPFARFCEASTLGCRFFSFLSAVDWKEQGLEVVLQGRQPGRQCAAADEDAPWSVCVGVSHP